MAPRALAVTLSIGMAALTLTPATAEPTPARAPAGTPGTRYCLRVDPVTGSRLQTIQCRTREDWASLELDVDQDWAENGVRVPARRIRRRRQRRSHPAAKRDCPAPHGR